MMRFVKPGQLGHGSWLPGEETDDGVMLGVLKSEHLEMIIDPSTNLLDWKNPSVFIRIGG